MYGTKDVRQLTIKEILSEITEYDIFKYYIGKDFKIGTIRSPLRKDSNPSFDIYRSPKTVRQILFKDHGSGESGSCFDFVMKAYGLSFMQALRLIDHDFNLKLSNAPLTKRPLTKGYVGKVTGVDVDKIQATCAIRVVRRKWNATTDKDFWGKYNISVKTLKKFHVKPIEALKINDRWFRFRKTEAVYCYWFGEYYYKIYQPYSTDFKWLSNTNTDILQGWDQLPENGEFIVITKSLKDIMVLDTIGVPAIAPQSEGNIPSAEVINNLRRRFKHIFSNYDYDYRGVVSANVMKKRYGITPLMFSHRWQAKDVSDFVKMNSIELLKKIKNEIFESFCD